jgi:dethiobiotin synthetase
VTLRDLAADLEAAVLVVTTVELGTLNHTALTLNRLRHILFPSPAW